jgi:hypothetical protein
VSEMRLPEHETTGRRFSGEDHGRAYVPAKAPEVLARFGKHSRHYEIKERLDY